ncbi:hypothetical protein KCA24_20275, partial [Escherichia coli]|nr:hypothetical protein [Escherichia coli]
ITVPGGATLLQEILACLISKLWQIPGFDEKQKSPGTKQSTLQFLRTGSPFWRFRAQAQAVKG